MSPTDPRHGTHRGYNLGCRQDCCRRAYALYRNLSRMGRTNKTIDGTGTRRRIQALQAIGWSQPAIAEAAGMTYDAVRRHLRDGRQDAAVWQTTADAIMKAYKALSMTPGPSASSATLARAKGWVPPLAWNDESIDDPSAEPAAIDTDPDYIDEVLVQRALGGVKVDANKPERAEIIRRWKTAGKSMAELERIQGWTTRRRAA